MAELKKLSVAQVARELDDPFSMVNVALVGHIVVSVYICQGVLQWHRHLDSDELFWVYEGTILLESEWGEVQLQPGELAVVPKTVGHRSGSEKRAVVLLLRSSAASDRDNGRRRLYALGGEQALKRVNLMEMARVARMPFLFQTLSQVEDSLVQVAWGEGTWPVEVPAPRDTFFFLSGGEGTLRTSESMLHLHPGEFTVVPQGVMYDLSTTRDTSLIRVMRREES